MGRSPQGRAELSTSMRERKDGMVLAWRLWRHDTPLTVRHLLDARTNVIETYGNPFVRLRRASARKPNLQ